jgi:dGTPase
MDLEDGFNLKLITQEKIEEALNSLLLTPCSKQVLEKFIDPREQIAFLRAKAISSLVTQVNEVFIKNISGIMNGKYDRALADEIPTASQLKDLKTTCQDRIYTYRKVLEIESAGFEVIGGLLSEFLSALKGTTKKAEKIKSLIPNHYLFGDIIDSNQRHEAIMHIVQFVVGMTDTFAIDTYRTIRGIRLPNY